MTNWFWWFDLRDFLIGIAFGIAVGWWLAAKSKWYS